MIVDDQTIGEKIIPDPLEASHIMSDEPSKPIEKSEQEWISKSGGEDNFPFSSSGRFGPECPHSLGRVLIISEDSMVREFLGQMSKLFGNDSRSCREWCSRDLEHTWQSYDVVFLDSHFWHQFKNLKVIMGPQVSEQPMVVILASEQEGCVFNNQESGLIRMLRKPLDYRQMGAILDECVQLNSQKPGSRDPEAGCV